ncbi:MAG: type 4 pilus major pilin, partial [Alphaproteobacteria bacterium]|nr:type 4 pilus major pilin [Alphaproteobacteria bacterium]
MRNTMHTASARRAATRGFTLTEIAIVLGIIGLILGAIWVAAAAVYSNMRTSKATTQLLQVTQAVRALYSTSSVTGAGAGNVNITADLIRAGVFPNDTVDITAGTVTNSFGGSIFVSSSTITTGGDAFSVLFSGVPQSGCIAMLVANTG